MEVELGLREAPEEIDRLGVRRHERPMVSRRTPLDCAPMSEPTGASEPTASAPRRSWGRTVVGLLLLALWAIALAALILTLDHPPTETGRPELTAQEHALLVPRLDAIDASIDRVVEEAATLALAGRDVLTRARALDPDGADAAVTTGSQASAAISALREDLIKRRDVLTADIDPSRPARDGPDTHRDHRPGAHRGDPAARGMGGGHRRRLRSGRSRTLAAGTRHEGRGGGRDRSRPTTSRVPSTRSRTPGRSSRQRVACARPRTGRVRMSAPSTTCSPGSTHTTRPSSASGQLLVASDGQVTDEVRAAYAEVEAAQASLPQDQDALKVVVSDLAGPAITAALVDIEQQRGLLADAVAARPDTSGG